MKAGCAGAVLISILTLAAACGGGAASPTTASTAIPTIVAAPGAAPGAPEEIAPGLLHAVKIFGDVRLVLDDEVRAALDASGKALASTQLTICLDAAGTATITGRRASGIAAFDQAAEALVATWRFDPFLRDGAAIPVCSSASFTHHDASRFPAKVPLPFDALDGLPPALIELGPNRRIEGSIRPELLSVAATPGVAAVRICREPGERTGPQVTLLQSSGDPAIDERLLSVRELVLRDEEPGPTKCRLASAIHAADEERRAEADADAAAAAPAGEATMGGVANVLEQQRISGTRNITPSDDVKRALARSGTTVLMVPVKLCLTRTGRVNSVKVLKSSGHMAYDLDLINGVAAWRYHPMLVNGTSAPVCSAIQFIFRLRIAPP